MSHTCPGPTCDRQVSDHMLMCRQHWYQVPRTLRDAAWATWRHGAGAGTIEHYRAITDAIDAITDQP